MKQEFSHKCNKKKPYQNKATVDCSRTCPEYPYCAPTQCFKLHVSQPGETVPQLSVNGVGLTKPLTTSLNPTSKHLSHLRELSKGGR